jgi:Zn-dependent protease
MSMGRAQVAHMLGDPTPGRMGLLSLNPIDHIDPVGTLAVPAALALIGAPVFGWGKGFVIDDANFRRPRMDAAVVAVTGPVIALFVGALAAVAVGGLVSLIGDAPQDPLLAFLSDCLVATLMTGCLLAVFNLLPVPGFDGGRVVEAMLPRKWADEFGALRQYSLFVVVLLVVIMPMLSPALDIFGIVIVPIAHEIAKFFLWGAGLAG